MSANLTEADAEKLRGQIKALIRTIGAEEAAKILIEHPAVGSMPGLRALLRTLWPDLLPAAEPVPVIPAPEAGEIERSFAVQTKLETVNGTIGVDSLGERICGPGSSAALELVVTAASSAWKSGGPCRISGTVTRLNPALVKEPQRLRFRDLAARIVVGAFDPGILFETLVDGVAISGHATTGDGWKSLRIAVGVSVRETSPWLFLGHSAQLSGSAQMTGERFTMADVSNDGKPDTPPVPTPGNRLAKLAAPGWFGGPVNFWYQANLAEMAQNLKVNHALGCIIEFRGAASQFGVAGVPAFNELVLRADLLATELEKRGLWLWIIDANWNAPYKLNPIAQFRAEADLLIAMAKGHRNILFQPVSERGSTKSGADTKKAGQVFAHYEKNWTGEMVWYCSGTEKAPARYRIADWHVGATKSLGGNGGAINTTNTDHSTILRELHGGNREGQAMDLALLVPFARRVQDAGRLLVLYGFFHKQPDYAAWAAMGRVFDAPATSDGPAAPETATGLLRSVKAEKDGFISWECDPAVDAWPATVSGGKKLNGWICLRRAGGKWVKVEQFRPGYRRQHLNNAYAKDEHGLPGIVTGETLEVKLAAKNSSAETNALAFVWPWKGT